jgi:hypothetical protein
MTIDEQLDALETENAALRAQVAEGRIAAALAATQSALGPVRKNKRNPHYRSTYADLAAVCEAIREPATAAGLSWSHTTRQGADGWIVIETTITHESGATRVHTFPARPAKSDPQSIAGIVSYGMRYGLIMAFGLATSDDVDGQPRRGRQPARRSGSAEVDMPAAAAALQSMGLTVEAVDAWRGAQGRPTLSALDAQQRATLIEYLRSSDQIRSQIENPDG